MKIKNTIPALFVLLLSALLLPGCIPTPSPSSSASSGVQASSTISTQSSTSSAQKSTDASVSSSVPGSASASASAASSVSSASGAGDQTIIGTFVKIEWGDYLHIYIKGNDGVEHSFFILHNVGMDTETLVAGQKIKITWHNADTYLPEVSQTFNFDEATKVELVG